MEPFIRDPQLKALYQQRQKLRREFHVIKMINPTSVRLLEMALGGIRLQIKAIRDKASRARAKAARKAARP